MMRIALIWAVAPLAALSLAAQVGAVEDTTGKETADPELVYTQALEKRANDVLAVLKLDDAARATRVREAIIAHYRGLRTIHDARDAEIKAIRGSTQGTPSDLDTRIKAQRDQADAAALALHQRFLTRLASDLTPEQVEQVQDKMTYNKLQVTYNAYLDMLPTLTAEQKRVVFETLKEARDKAAYAGSSEEKSNIFNKFKGRINNYLASQGYDLKQATKEWAERRKPAK